MKDDGKIQKINDLLEQIYNLHIKRDDNFHRSIFMWQMFNEASDDLILDKVISQMANHLKLEEQWTVDAKIIYIEDYKRSKHFSGNDDK